MQVEAAVGSDAGAAAHDRQREPVQHQAGPHHGLQLCGVPVHRLGFRAPISQAAHHRHHIPTGTTMVGRGARTGSPLPRGVSRFFSFFLFEHDKEGNF